MKRLLISLAAFIAVGFPFVLLAQTQCSNGFCQLADTSQSPLLNQAYQSNGLANFLNALFKIAISVGAILAVLQITYAGFLYMSSEAFGEKSHAKEVIGNAVLGLLLLLSVYLILYQINPNLVSLKFLEEVKSDTTTQTQTSGTGQADAGQSSTVQSYNPAAPIQCPPGQHSDSAFGGACVSN